MHNMTSNLDHVHATAAGTGGSAHRHSFSRHVPTPQTRNIPITHVSVRNYLR